MQKKLIKNTIQELNDELAEYCLINHLIVDHTPAISLVANEKNGITYLNFEKRHIPKRLCMG